MALHVELEADIHGYADTAKENCSFGFSFSGKTLNTLTKEASARLNLAAAAADVAYGFQSVTTGKLILIKAEAAVNVKINGIGNPAISLAPQTNSSTNVVTPAFLAIMGDGITSLHFTNPNASDAVDVDVAVAGV